MRSVCHQAGLKVSFLSPALALPWSRQRGGSLDNLVPVLLQSLHFFLMFCGKGRARKLEPPPNQCKTLCSSFSFGILSSRSLRWHQKLQDINRMEQSLGHCPCRRCHLMCPTLSRLTALCFPWSCWCVQGRGRAGPLAWDSLWLLPPRCAAAFPSSYVTTSSEHFLDLFLSCCSSELIPELTFGTCSEISALQVCLGSPQRLLSCARWCRNNSGLFQVWW